MRIINSSAGTVAHLPTHLMVVIMLGILLTPTVVGQPAGELNFGGPRLSVNISERDGRILSLLSDGVQFGRTPPDRPCLDLKIDDRWLVGQDRVPVRLTDRKRHGNTLQLTRRIGDIEIVEHLSLHPDELRLARRFEITNRGQNTVRIGGFWVTTLGVSGRAKSMYGLPRNYPPQSFAFAELEPGRQRSTHQKLAPMIVQLSPERSLVFVSDSRTDHVSGGVTEGDGLVTISQGFNVLGWLRPGVTQTDIGTAYTGLIDGGYEGALHSLWGWMSDVGLTVPPDRPDWFPDAVLYSFHPGGTIGSRFSDLGGFRAAAQRLLPRLPQLGVDAIWMLPVEDASPYVPRDYYAFQEGLGTPDEFRQLIARAHDLGLNALMDIVPHGGRNTNQRAKQHPEWLVRNLEGNTLPYWCFDFNYPSWQDYMADVAGHYVTEYDADGYRVDACAGSKIPNWSKDIPYQRASLAKLHGGLGMLSHIRSAVKSIKPQKGAILAETQGAPYAAVSDAVYDFTLCNSIIHDWRKIPADVFVRRLRTWLEEQKYTDPPGTIHLRHVENHDTLRGQGWYGVRGMRTVAALMAWIHGMPLVYHNMEVGHEDALRQIYEIRDMLPELRRGEAFYTAVDAGPPHVFAFLRAHDGDVSLVAINFGTADAEVQLRWNAANWLSGDGEYLVYDARARNYLGPPRAADALRTLSVSLPALGYNVLALRPADRRHSLPVTHQPQSAGSRDQLRLEASEDTTELPVQIRINGRPALELHDVLVPQSLHPQRRQASPTPNALPLADGAIELTHSTLDAGLRFDTRLIDVPERGDVALVLRVPHAAHYQLNTADGVLSASPFVVSRDARGRYAWIYWRPQGTSTFYDSLLTPLHPTDPWLQFADANGNSLRLTFPDRDRLPVTVQLHDRYADREGLFVVLHWRRDLLSTESFAFGVTAPRSAEAPTDRALHAGPVSARQVGPWWIVENDHYRLLLHKTGGVIRELVDKRRPDEPIISHGDLYTDRGLCAVRDGAKQHTSAANDVESAVRLSRDGDRLQLYFEGQFRGMNRFARTHPPLRYYLRYTFDETATFRHTWGWLTERGLRREDGFLSTLWTIDPWRNYVYIKGGDQIDQSTRGDGLQRQGQSKSLQPPRHPDRIHIRAEHRPLLTISDLTTRAPASLRNVFFHAANFFIAWLDGPNETCRPHQWHEASALITIGDSEPAHLPGPHWRAEKPLSEATDNLVTDGSFEQSGGRDLVSYRTGDLVPWPQPHSHWSVPTGGSFVRDVTHDRNVAAKVVNDNNGYLLFRQSVPIDLTPGGKYRLSAWVRGANLVRGGDPWRTGTVRIAFTTPDGARYAEVAGPLGTFDWKHVSATITVPEGATSADVQVGVNGGTGTMWIDDVELTVED